MLSLPLKAETTCLLVYWGSLFGVEKTHQKPTQKPKTLSFPFLLACIQLLFIPGTSVHLAPNSAISSTTACLNQQWNHITPRKKKLEKKNALTRFNKPRSQETQFTSCNKTEQKKTIVREKESEKRKKGTRFHEVVPLSDHLEPLHYPLGSPFLFAFAKVFTFFFVTMKIEERVFTILCKIYKEKNHLFLQRCMLFFIGHMYMIVLLISFFMGPIAFLPIPRWAQ